MLCKAYCESVVDVSHLLVKATGNKGHQPTVNAFCCFCHCCHCCHCCNNLLNCCCLETRAPLPVPTLQLWVVASAIAWVGLLVLYTIPIAAWQLWLRHCRKACQQQTIKPAHPDASTTDADSQQAGINSPAGFGAGERTSSTNQTPKGQQQEQEQPQEQPLPPPQQQQQKRTWQHLKAGIKAAALSVLIGTLLNMSAVGSAGAAKLVNAYIVQLLLLLTPLVCAVCDMLVLRQPSPPRLLPAVLLSLAGGGLVVGGYWLQERQGGSRVAVAVQAKGVAVGVVVSLLAMVGQALYFVMVQLTRSSLTAQQVCAVCQIRIVGLCSCWNGWHSCCVRAVDCLIPTSLPLVKWRPGGTYE